MRHFISYLLFLIVVVLSSCELETSSHGKLYGMWHMERIDSLTAGSQKNLKEARLFWSFQNKLLELDDKDGMLRSVLLRFEEADKHLIVYDPYLYNREEGDEPLSDVSALLPFGVGALRDTFAIEKLSGSRLVLKRKNVRLHFKRF